MNPYPYNPNNTNQFDQFSNMSRYQGRKRMGTPSSDWNSPPYRQRQKMYHHQNYNDYNFPNGGPRSSNNSNHYFSPQSNSRMFQIPNANYSSTPHRSFSSNSSTPHRSFSSNNSFHGNDSGFTSSPHLDRFQSHSYHKRGNRSNNRRSFNRSGHQEKPDQPIEVYFKPSMLENPWKKLEAAQSGSSDCQNSCNEVIKQT